MRFAPSTRRLRRSSSVRVSARLKACEVRILTTAPDEVRRERAMARDGDTFRPHWERWAEQ